MQKPAKFKRKLTENRLLLPPRPTELQIENEIFSWAKWLGFGVWKTKNKGERHTSRGIEFFKKGPNPGFQDLTLCVRGRYVAIEVKRNGEKQTPLQIAHQKEIERTGGIYLVCYSSYHAEIQFREKGLLL